MGKPVFQIAERAGLWTYDDNGELIQADAGVSHAKQPSYTIVTADTVADLLESVNDLLPDGWVPIGAPFYVAKNFDVSGWHQALFMEGE